LVGQSRFASTVFSVKAREGESGGEQLLFVVGLNEKKFFGQDGAEEALKLLERIAEQQGARYNLLFSLTERQYAEMEDDNKIKNQRLTPSRDLEHRRNCEFIPIMQAGMIDKCGRRPLGRILRCTQGHVAWQMWNNPREAVKLYWAYWRRKEFKNAAQREFWMKHFPVSAHAYFEEHAELAVIRTAELMTAAHNQGKSNTWVLVVGNQFYQPMTERLNLLLDESATEKMGSADFSRHLRDRATELVAEVPDLTALLIFIYAGFPILLVQTILLGIDRLWYTSGAHETVFVPEHRD